MQSSTTWTEGVEFRGTAGEHSVIMDAKAPVGKNKGLTPKEMVALALSGCTAMDVISLLKKHKQVPQKFSVESDIDVTKSGHPLVFERAVLEFRVDGNVNPEVLKEAVVLSQTKYCSVSAMLSEALPIEYRIFLNGNLISTGTANFEPRSEPQIVS